MKIKIDESLMSLCVNDIEKIMIKVGGSSILFPQDITETELYLIIRSILNTSVNGTIFACSADPNGYPLFESDADLINWFYESHSNKVLLTRKDFHAGFLWSPAEDLVLLFGIPSFMESAAPYPNWVTKSRFINGSVDTYSTGWPAKVWDQIVGS